MITINIFKAQGIGTKTVDSRILDISVELPPFESLTKTIAEFESQALLLADALCETLPGGTLDRLVAELLKRKATSFNVPLFDK
jgi:hypothetical protein